MSRATLAKDPREVAGMFDAVARRYDLTNDVMSFLVAQPRSPPGHGRGSWAICPGARDRLRRPRWSRPVRDELAARIRLAVSLVPAGSVVSYGDVAALVGTGPRQVGAFMRDHGEDLPWWRVVNASGELPPWLRGMARTLWAEEGIAERANGSGCQIERHRAELPAWADAVEAAQR